jgi:hypothetical protein
MNPNLRFAQAILGVTEGRGIGILDLRAFSHLVDALRILELSPSWPSEDRAAFSRWCTEYLAWVRQSENGKEERSQSNNHGTLYDMQTASIAVFLGDSVLAREILVNSAKARVDSQIAADGSQPLELARTRPIHYSLFNLDAFTQSIAIRKAGASNPHFDLLRRMQVEAGRGARPTSLRLLPMPDRSHYDEQAQFSAIRVLPMLPRARRRCIKPLHARWSFILVFQSHRLCGPIR